MPLDVTEAGFGGICEDRPTGQATGSAPRARHGLHPDVAPERGPERQSPGRRRRGARAFASGQAAEEQVARDYLRRGLRLERRRYRCARGEIDLVMRDGAALIFVEVKKSATFARAAERLSRRQMARIYRAAEEYLASEPAGQLTEARFDVALVDGSGAVAILENAFGMC